MQVQFIDTLEALSQICKTFSDSNFLAVDTEFERQTTYYPKLALVQICDGKQLALIDPLALKDLTPLMNLLYQPAIIKVFHSARQDLEIFYFLQGSVPENIFDTQIAAALSGFGEQIGYANLVKQLLNIELDKSQTRTDWLKRPLTQKQLTYAADDVRHLAELYPIQKQQLEQQDRLQWLRDDFDFLSSSSTYAPAPQTMWCKIRGVNRLKKQQLAIIQKLTAWREQQAIERNRPRRRILSDEALIALSVNAPATQEELYQNYKLNRAFLNHHAADLMTLIQKGLQTPDQDCPVLPSYQKLSQDEEALADCLMAVLHMSARDNQISPACLCSRKELNALIQGRRDLAILSGWRKELAGNDLLLFLEGKKLLSYHSGRLRLVSPLNTLQNTENNRPEMEGLNGNQ